MAGIAFPGAFTSQKVTRTFIACSTAIFVKQLANTLGQVALKPPSDYLAEDQYLVGLAKANESQSQDNSTFKRLKAVMNNDREAIPFDLLCITASLLACSNAEDKAEKLSKMLIAYTGLRFMHSMAYMFQIGPLRSLSFIGSKCVASGFAFMAVKELMAK